ncbi:MAG: non-canonical purine NTP diphosphatase [Bacteroidales bacterium]|nr:non-canonical purine NTP diphosphatase [Bacteroidales bacterium]MCF8352685.1 non-canonical purine NTP diphosphatase [Bacteroidales bacterium]MCF8376619.1 non-canonical purine NTP diphosphatase [Bacteroidales bacterium]MCF8400659.1 non-canonical purine NTP diphosphatase [Bacteroidales bacterium]
MKIVFATNNQHKLKEVKNLAGHGFEIAGLNDIGCAEDIAETGETLEENALIKASFIKERFDLDCFADDTGLEIEALDGKPGVYSARYAGPENDFRKNIAKVLNELRAEENRKARFRTVIALRIEDETHYFEGIVEGRIIDEMRGQAGFGYDPVFLPNGFDQTFAEMNLEQKNRISHRARATAKLIEFLKNKLA